MPQSAASPVTSNLQAALQAEREAASRLREVRDRVAMTVATLADSGMSYDRLACLTIRARTGEAPTLCQRKREADRLRQIVHRQHVTGSHDNGFRKLAKAPASRAQLLGKEIEKMQRLIKRTTTTETFLTDGNERHPIPEDLDDRDEVELDDDRDEKDDESPRAARPRR